jgi:hypothetical protein
MKPRELLYRYVENVTQKSADKFLRVVDEKREGRGKVS